MDGWTIDLDEYEEEKSRMLAFRVRQIGPLLIMWGFYLNDPSDAFFYINFIRRPK